MMGDYNTIDEVYQDIVDTTKRKLLEEEVKNASTPKMKELDKKMRDMYEDFRRKYNLSSDDMVALDKGKFKVDDVKKYTPTEHKPF